MLYIKKTQSTGRYEINIFGFKMKFRIGKSRKYDYRERFDNLLYELADPRTLREVQLPKVINDYDSLYEIIKSDKSIARYGDGEFKLIMGENISFQKYDPKLSQRLKEILKNNNENLLVGVADIFGRCNSSYMRKVMLNCRETLYKYMDFSGSYIDASITRKLHFVSKEQGLDYFDKVKSLWQNKDVIIVEGAGSRLGIGNDLFDNTASVKRIIGPIKDAYSKYDDILKICLEQPKDALFVLALGPAATVLADDLSKANFRALDMGHTDLAYEAFLKDSMVFVPVEGKIVFNEDRHKDKIKHCADEKYYKQIISTIDE